MPYLRALVLVAALAAGAGSAFAQATGAEQKVAETAHVLADSAVVEERGDTVVFPVFGYTPDTSLLFGATLLRFFYLDPEGPNTRPSLFSPVFVYTAKSQTLAFLGVDLNWDEGRWHAGFVPSYQKFPDQFYGIGRDAPESAEEDFTPEQFAVEVMLERRVLGELRVGLEFRLAQNQLLEVEAGGLLDGSAIVGASRTVVSAPGVALAWDTRDHTWSTRRGAWVRASTSFYRSGWGSDLGWTDYEIDARGYAPLGDRAALAGQVLYNSAEGSAPFFELSRLGGQSGLRGYPGGRYMDRSLALLRGEWRSGEVFGRLGGVVFAGLGDVAPTPAKLTTAARLYTVGAGLRFTLSRDELVKIRLDMGWGNGAGGFHLSLGEAF
ncbi:MAG: BamA/TamA family outer membrane protein [bacterium]|nr:BamA/TamA family outer membrane protein [bacterium]